MFTNKHCVYKLSVRSCSGKHGKFYCIIKQCFLKESIYDSASVEYKRRRTETGPAETTVRPDNRCFVRNIG